MGMGGYEHMGRGQNGLAGSMLSTIRYQVPQTAALAGHQPQWQAQYTILPQQMTQMMQGVEGQQAGYSMAQMNQLAAQMNQLGLSSPYNQSPYSGYGYNPAGMYPAGMAALGGGPGGQGDEVGPGVGVALEGAHSGVNSVSVLHIPDIPVNEEEVFDKFSKKRSEAIKPPIWHTCLVERPMVRSYHPWDYN